MTQMKNGARAEENAPAEKFALIPDAALQELHRRLLAVAGKERGARTREGVEQYAAARVAVWFDLKDNDTVLDGDGGTLRDALGAALLDKTRKNRRIALVWGGERGADWHDALEAARAQSLPMVFVCEEDGAGELRTKLVRKARAAKPGEELPSITVDGHDVVAAYRVAHEAIERARRDRGPTLILLATYRVGGRAYTDAVADMEEYLRGRGLLRPGS